VSFPRHRRHQEPSLPDAPGHEVRVVDGRFTTAVCSCGWHGAGRRNRATAREEARDHALLYADGSELSAAAPSAPSEDVVLPDVVLPDVVLPDADHADA